ncbi:hypothetical protein PN36_19220 [Candidatus Thiomargarita nelsonii]|uniref:Transposase n=1 Tax=Candidatus Thiomargarita nelsonii TaxID=1003181 RepID=A0A0A6S6N1_9GAMM|nr:hypothetical protein PN36_19220 [Candidatus Thiomargarita nelsonii]
MLESKALALDWQRAYKLVKNLLRFKCLVGFALPTLHERYFLIIVWFFNQFFKRIKRVYQNGFSMKFGQKRVVINGMNRFHQLFVNILKTDAQHFYNIFL